MAQTSQRLLLKLRSVAGLAAAAPQANLRPLFDEPRKTAASETLGLISGTPTWYVADLPDMEPNPWDSAHSQVADALGIDDSAILFAEPDLPQSYPDQNEINPKGSPLAIAPPDCSPKDQQHDQRPSGPGFAWHLRDEFSQLAAARAAVAFSDPNRTRLAHIDTGYDGTHSARPARLLLDVQRNFVSQDNNPNNANDPDRGHLFDNSGHGTGTIGILAGQKVPQNNNDFLGGAPDADILPIRIANSVVLFFTSAFAQGINYAVQQQCDVVSISMGGLPSSAWNEAVNNAYMAGICIVAASGDCFGGLPSHHVVYPARYHRTIAACGAMANGEPYFNLPIAIIEGSFGPDSAMVSALASYTPNTPWARWGCKDTIDMDGAGTSSSTPQIAAAVALWYEKYKQQLPRDWRRVEAVRNALFRSAKQVDSQHFGRGILQARAALDLAPQLNLPQTPADDDSFSFLRVITGLGISEPSPRERMLNLELCQRYMSNSALPEAIPDPAVTPSKDDLRKFLDAVIADKGASITLRNAVAARYALLVGTQVPGTVIADIAPTKAVYYPETEIPKPVHRRVRAYAVDPSFATRLETASINQTVVPVDWEHLEPGPKGEYLEVIDQDADGSTYAPVDLNDSRLLAQDGFAPSESNPQFHQQMVYAVSMTTIRYFEQALGRRVLWRAKPEAANQDPTASYIQRLAIKPHALREANAYYDPDQIALLFGYFRAAANDPGDHVPGSTVFSCLSHDIVAHETTHAILDGMHRYFMEPTNSDVLALHEAFADIVALMQHFAIPGVLELQIAKTRGDLESESLLGQMAVQFGRAIGGRGALRDAIGFIDSNGQWHRQVPDPTDYQKITTPHERGSLLVASVFDAFLAIYKARTADLYRIYTGGTGVLPPGAIQQDLVRRLSSEAATSARHVLNICIRALDYVPPVDITFGEYLRGIITADFDLVPDDTYGYRIAFVEAFRRRGIYPRDVSSLSVDSLRWRGLDVSDPRNRYKSIVASLKKFADESLYISDRKELFHRTHQEREKVKSRFLASMQTDPDLAKILGVDASLPFDVYALRRSERTGPDGQRLPQMVVVFTQERTIPVAGADGSVPFRGGASVLVDLKTPEIKYAIRKRINQQDREQDTRTFLEKGLKNPLTKMLLDPSRTNRFAALHSLLGLAD